jgi:hypothetical protein
MVLRRLRGSKRITMPRGRGSGRGMLNEQVPPPCHTRPSKPALIRHLGQDPPIPPTPSPTYERLRDYIAKRMRMSP